MKSIILGCFLFAAFSASADSFYVGDVDGAEVSAQDRHAVHELVRIAVTQQGGKVTSAQEASGSDWTLVPQLLKLGDAYILTIEKRNSKSGSVVFSESKKSSSMGNMDVTAKRLVSAVIRGEKFDDTADVTNITEEDTKRNFRRYEATRQWMIAFGPSWSSRLNSSGGGYTFLLGFEWGLDPDFSVDLSWLGASGKSNDDSRFTDFSLGGTYYFQRTKFSPFVTTRFGYGSVHSNTECTIFTTCYSDASASGWTGSVAGGVKFFRTSNVNVSLSLRYSYLFATLNDRNPSLTSLMIGVHY